MVDANPKCRPNYGALFRVSMFGIVITVSSRSPSVWVPAAVDEQERSVMPLTCMLPFDASQRALWRAGGRACHHSERKKWSHNLAFGDLAIPSMECHAACVNSTLKLVRPNPEGQSTHRSVIRLCGKLRGTPIENTLRPHSMANPLGKGASRRRESHFRTTWVYLGLLREHSPVTGAPS